MSCRIIPFPLPSKADATMQPSHLRTSPTTTMSLAVNQANTKPRTLITSAQTVTIKTPPTTSPNTKETT